MHVPCYRATNELRPHNLSRGFIWIVAVIVACLCPISVFAQCTETWSGGAAGSWNTGTNWTPTGPPTAASNTCISTPNSAVTINFSGATDNLTLGLSTDSLIIANGQVLQFGPDPNGFTINITNNGTINLQSTGNTTEIILTGNTVLKGKGKLILSNN